MDNLAEYFSGPEQCFAVDYDYNRAKGKFGAQQGFYSFADWMSNNLLHEILFFYDGQEKRLLNFIYLNKGSVSEIISDANYAQSSNTVSYLRQLIITVSNVILFSLLLAFTIIFGVSVDDLSYGVRSNTVTTKNNWYNYKNGMTELKCSFENYVTKPFLEQQTQFGPLASEATGIWWKNSGAAQLSMFDLPGYNASLQNTNDMGQQLLNMLAQFHPTQLNCNYQIDALANIVQLTVNDTTSIVNSMPDMQQTILFTNSQSQNTKRFLFNQFLTMTNNQLETFNEVEERLRTVNHGLQLAGFDAQNYSNIAADFINKRVEAYKNDSNDLVTVFTLLLVLIPMTIILIAMLLAVGTCIKGQLFPKTQLPARITELINVLMRVGALTVFFTAWLICSVSIAYLVIPNPFATTCHVTDVSPPPVFPYGLPVHFYSFKQKTNDTPYFIDYGQFRTALQGQVTLFDALGSVNIQNISAVIENLSMPKNLQHMKDFIAYAGLALNFNEYTYYTLQTQSNILNADTALLASNINDKHFLSECLNEDIQYIHKLMESYLLRLNSIQEENSQLLQDMQNIINFNQEDTRVEMSSYVDGVYTTANITLSSNLHEYQDQLSQSIYPSDAITAVYDRTWNVLCSQIRSPLDAVWISASFLGIFMLMAGYLLLLTARSIDKTTELDADYRPAVIHARIERKPDDQVVPKTQDPEPEQHRYENTTTTAEESTDYSEESVKPQPALYPTIDLNALTDLEHIKCT